MAANNSGVPKRTTAPNTIERVGIGDGGSDPSAPKSKQAPPAFTFGGAGSSTSSHLALMGMQVMNCVKDLMEAL